jgi:hypothetical protein
MFISFINLLFVMALKAEKKSKLKEEAEKASHLILRRCGVPGLYMSFHRQGGGVCFC